MKKLLFISSVCVLAACSNSNTGEVTAEWDVCNSQGGSVQTITLKGDLRGVERLAFNQFPRGQKIEGASDTLVEIVPGYYAIGSPSFAGATGNDSLTFSYAAWPVMLVADLPDAFHLVMKDGTTRPVAVKYADLSSNPTVTYHEATGEVNYSRNEELAAGKAGVYDAIPSFKSVSRTGGESAVDPANIEYAEAQPGANPEAYTVTVADGKIKVEAPRRQWARIGLRLRNLFGNASVTLPNAVITDEPTMPYRGLMVDVARNFTTPEEMCTVLDQMATYGLNVLHFHPIDDEAWRLEIAALPELTEVGARRGYTPGSDAAFLEQIYSGDGNPATVGGSSNGKYTRADFVGMLRYADSLGIAVIPEIESPGHARAAIKAMAVRAKNTGDNSWLLNEGAAVDTAKYTSAQGYHDNVMNPALEGPYKLMDAFADEIVAMYNEAGVELPAIHIGGDEVPHGSWSASPAIAALKEKEGLETEKDIHAYFVRKVADRFAAKGIRTSGWQEVALDHNDAYNKSVAPEMYSVNCWSTMPSGDAKSVVDRIAEAGFPVVLSNVEHFYLDMQYAPNPAERGLRWAGWSDEFSGLSGYPAELCKVPGANVLGVQGQIFAETIRNLGDVQRMMFPKMLGMAERGWNPAATYSEPDFNAAVAAELPKWDAAGVTYHLRQPGLKVTEDNKLVANSPYAGAVVRVTLDGSTPDETSREMKPGEAIDLAEYPDASVARAVLFTPTQHSAPVTLRLK